MENDEKSTDLCMKARGLFRKKNLSGSIFLLELMEKLREVAAEKNHLLRLALQVKFFE